MKNLPKEELLSRLEAINRSNAIIYFDLNGVILGVNDIFLEAMGYGKGNHDDIIGKKHSIFVCEDYSRSLEYEKFWDILRSGKYYTGEFERRRKNGSLINLQATYNPIFDEDGKITKIMKIATDVIIMEEKQFIQYIIKDKPKKGSSKAEFQNFDEDESTPDTGDLNVIDIG